MMFLNQHKEVFLLVLNSDIRWCYLELVINNINI